MYNYNFKESNESLIREVTGVNVKIDGNYYDTHFVLTEKNLLCFYDSNHGNVLRGRGIPIPPRYDLLFKIDLNNIKYEIKANNLILLIDNVRINCYDFDIEKFIK